MLFFSRWVYWSGRSLPGAGDCTRAKATPLVYDRIVDNVSNVLMCRNCKDIIFVMLRMFQNKNTVRFFSTHLSLSPNHVFVLPKKRFAIYFVPSRLHPLTFDIPISDLMIHRQPIHTSFVSLLTKTNINLDKRKDKHAIRLYVY